MTTPAQRTLYAWQGAQKDYAALQIKLEGGAPAANIFTSGTTLTAAVWEGQNQATLFAPTVAWNNSGAGWATGQFQVSFLPTPTATLDPNGEYQFIVWATTSGVTSVAWQGPLKILPTPGSVTPNPPDLVGYDYCLGQLRLKGNLTDDQIDCVPALISAASQLWRLACNERYFDLRSLVEWHEVSLDGYVRLWQEPVQIITRVQGVPQLALTIFNNSSSVQTAQAYFSYTGYDGGYGSNAKTATGVILNWISNGVPAAQANPLFATYSTLGQLATAINAVGSGWSAQVNTNYSEWACTELTGGFVAQGCTGYSIPANGAQFNVLTDLTTAKLRPRSPMLYVGQQYGGNQEAQQWGPGGESLWGSQEQNLGLVKVSYEAGFSTIPADVQNQVVRIVSWKLDLGVQELLLKSEEAGDYKYELDPEMVGALPKDVQQAVGRWKAWYA